MNSARDSLEKIKCAYQKKKKKARHKHASKKRNPNGALVYIIPSMNIFFFFELSMNDLHCKLNKCVQCYTHLSNL